MNREEEIEELASKYADDYGYFNVDLDDVACGFIDGAKWADEHPSSSFIVKKNLELSNKDCYCSTQWGDALL